MTRTQLLCTCILGAVFTAGLLADLAAPWPYAQQFRETPNAPPSAKFWLGTDALGRDRYSRMIHATRVSLLLSLAAAALAVTGAAFIGGVAGMAGGVLESALMSASELTMALPWMFLLLTVRAILPLDTSPEISVVITFTMMGLLGWAGPARVIRRRVIEIRASNYILAARARGLGSLAILSRHVIPNLRPLLKAQFWSSIPVFILAEANLGMLGLGVNEPLPSWGTLLKALEREVGSGNGLRESAASLAPLLLLMTVVGCMQIRFGSRVTK